MSEIDENLERQINRALDGELTEDERLELDRELLRRPQARQMMDRSAQLDALAGNTLRAVLADEPGPSLTLPRRSARAGYTRAWWLLPGAVAAALLAVFLVYAPPTPNAPSLAERDNLAATTEQQPVGLVPQPAIPGIYSATPSAGMVPVRYRPTWVDRAVDRGVYGVRGSDGNIYLIEVNHTRTREQPGTRARIRPVGGDL